MKKFISYLLAIIKSFKIVGILVECIRLQNTDKPNFTKHDELKNYINEYLAIIELDITDLQVDGIIKLLVKLMNFKKN